MFGAVHHYNTTPFFVPLVSTIYGTRWVHSCSCSRTYDTNISNMHVWYYCPGLLVLHCSLIHHKLMEDELSVPMGCPCSCYCGRAELHLSASCLLRKPLHWYSLRAVHCFYILLLHLTIYITQVYLNYTLFTFFFSTALMKSLTAMRGTCCRLKLGVWWKNTLNRRSHQQ
jgi:hypothetical protein